MYDNTPLISYLSKLPACKISQPQLSFFQHNPFKVILMSYFMSTILASSVIAASPTNLTWTPETIIHTNLISDVQISPDNASVLFVATRPQMEGEKGSMVSQIYKSQMNNRAEPFTTFQSSSMQPRWSPDGQWIAYLTTNEGVNQLTITPSQGGDETLLTSGKHSVQTFNWSPDGKKIAFVMEDETEAEKLREKTSIAYTYMLEPTVNRLWIVDAFANDKQLHPLTTDEYCVRGSGDFGTINSEFDWSPDSKEIVFAYSPSAGLDDYHLDSSLATVDVASATITAWEKLAPYESMPRYSPDGKSVGYLTCDTSTRYSIDRQAAIRTSCGKQRKLLAHTFNEGVLLAGANLLGWSNDGKNLILFEPKGTKYHLVMIPAEGKPTQELATGDLFFKDPSLSHDRTMLGFIAQSPSVAPEAFVAKLDAFEPQSVSALNESLSAYPQTRTETVHWKAEDGLQIEGLLTYPVDYQKGTQYPLLVVIHGGPMGFFEESYLGTPNPYPLASFAQEGFFIFRPNPRGSTGYGRSFRTANYNDWGGKDYTDILTGVDALIAKGLVDNERMGVMGWSYGGYMSAWIVTQTSRFKAASIGAGPCNLISMNGTTDLYRFLGDYFDDSSIYEKRSPLFFTQNVETPCLIQHGTADKRVPVSQAQEFYHALTRQGKTVQLILYPNMGHRLSDPNMQLDAMKSNLSWFKRHLKGE